MEASGIEAITGEEIDVSNTNMLCHDRETSTSNAKDMEVYGSSASKKLPPGPEAGGNRQREAQPNTASLGKLPIARASKISLPSGGSSTKISMMVCVSTLKLMGFHSEAVGGTSKMEEMMWRMRYF